MEPINLKKNNATIDMQTFLLRKEFVIYSKNNAETKLKKRKQKLNILFWIVGIFIFLYFISLINGSGSFLTNTLNVAREVSLSFLPDPGV
tara:strand:- start:3756 stop:4025 length:270 start_codon:yes stop_codon:yes gene_type:complete